ncbi:M20/M25/M40 family metallo-hydrolase [bacterium]|nr:MAG: M20/M25/M40 family metallo-hydrolase [bacterium]
MSMASLRTPIETLSALPTRHSSSPHNRVAVDWIAQELAQIPGVRIERMRFELAEGPRVPLATEVEQVLAWIEGSEPGIVGVGAHLDSINMTDPRSIELLAPGANDDLSGIAAMIHAAALWAKKPRRKTGLFVAFNAEEQGLLGAKALAERTVGEDWPLEAFLNMDMIANIGAKDMAANDREIRVYSDEGSRELARYAEFLQSASGDPFRIKLVLRPDRIRRGGDHTPLAQRGYRAIRFTEAVERYDVQHTPLDTVEHVDFEYLEKVATCVARVAVALGDGESSPSEVRAERSGQGTRLAWLGDPGQTWTVYWRDTRSAEWTDSREVRGTTLEIPVNLDDNLFGVGAKGAIPVPATL